MPGRITQQQRRVCQVFTVLLGGVLIVVAALSTPHDPGDASMQRASLGAKLEFLFGLILIGSAVVVEFVSNDSLSSISRVLPGSNRDLHDLEEPLLDIPYALVPAQASQGVPITTVRTLASVPAPPIISSLVSSGNINGTTEPINNNLNNLNKPEKASP